MKELDPQWREKIHDCIKEWHDGAGSVLLIDYLHEVLGMDEKTYAKWVEEGD